MGENGIETSDERQYSKRLVEFYVKNSKSKIVIRKWGFEIKPKKLLLLFMNYLTILKEIFVII